MNEQTATTSTTATASFESGVGFWLKRAYLAIRKEYDEELAKHELTYPQWEIVRMLCSQDGIEQRNVQQRLGIQSATLTGIVDGLVDRHLVERRLSPDDARVKELYLTDEGKCMQQLSPEVLTRINTRIAQDFSGTELALFKEWLMRVVHNLEDEA
ncbi:MAG: MarR family transcriptional regulator [Chloroflexales bacterium]|nr:MarR family transcriptional regulator [Chloroflexales bacterium]